MTYNDEPLEYVQSFKYLGLNFNSKCSFVESLDKYYAAKPEKHKLY